MLGFSIREAGPAVKTPCPNLANLGTTGGYTAESSLWSNDLDGHHSLRRG